MLFRSGLLTTTKTVENYPGFPNGVDGFDLTERFKEQSIKFGTTIKSETVISIDKIEEEQLFTINTASNNVYKTKSVIIATGSKPNKLNIPGFDTFWHHGVSTCAICDGSFYKNVPVAVVGGGDSACEDALHLANIASIVYLIHRREIGRAHV